MSNTLNRTKFLEDSELTKLKESLDLTKRDDCIIALALETGARASEVLAIGVNDFFESGKTVFIRAKKEGVDREIPIRDELFEAARKHVPFNISYRRLDQIWQSRKPVNKKFHSLRHTFAVNLYLRTRDIKLVQLALGHRSPTNTAIYTDFVYSTEQMRRILA